MRRLTAVVSALGAVMCVAVAAQPADPIAGASSALGVSEVVTLRVTGFGATYSVGQSPTPSEPWPRVTLKNYDALIDYLNAFIRVELTREMGPIQPRGGGQPFTGEQRQIQIVSGTVAWDVTPPRRGRQGGPGAPAPAPEPPEKAEAPVAPAADAQQPPAPAQPDAQPPAPGQPNAQPPATSAPPPAPPPPQPRPEEVVARNQQIWLTPHGFLRAARANQAHVQRVPDGTEVSFVMEGNRRFVGVINARNEVERVQTWLPNPVLGDMLLETVYRDYETVAPGVRFPMHIVQRQGGHRSLELWVASVQPNPTADITVPDSVRGITRPSVTVSAEMLAEGVHYITGGSHHSVAIEMRDHVVVVEAPLDEARSLAVLGKVRELVPEKPVRYVINTHHHFDHAGGLRTYVAEGATVVTHAMNRPFFEQAWSAPRTISPDRLAGSPKPAAFETFTDKHVLTDGARTVEVYRIAGSPHHDGFAMVYLPAEKILIEADAYTPAVETTPTPAPATPPPAGAPGPPPPAVNPSALNLYDNIQRLKLDVERIAALHGPRVATLDDLARAVGRGEMD